MPVSTPPHGLELVIDFVNTYDAETEVDELATPASAPRATDRKLLTRDAGTPSVRASAGGRSACARRSGGRCSSTTV